MAATHTLYIAKVCPYAHRSYIVAHELGVIGKEVTVGSGVSHGTMVSVLLHTLGNDTSCAMCYQ
jgi:glutathionyl-hydroquinone reductase